MLACRRFSWSEQLQRAAENAPALKNGASGDGVWELQDALYDLGYALRRSFKGGRADGMFGPETADAVRAFQRDEGLEPDGVAGRQTLGRLDAMIAADPRLDAPDPLRTAAQDVGDRSRPLYRRHRANW